jgi:hypothetical protein
VRNFFRTDGEAHHDTIALSQLRTLAYLPRGTRSLESPFARLSRGEAPSLALRGRKFGGDFEKEGSRLEDTGTDRQFAPRNAARLFSVAPKLDFS